MDWGWSSCWHAIDQSSQLRKKQCPSHISEVNAELPRRAELNVLLNLLGWHDSLLDTEIQAFLGLVGHYQQFIKAFACIAQPLHEHLSGKGASKKNEWVLPMADPRNAFKMLKKACLEGPCLAFANFNKPFLLETDANKLGLGAMLSIKQADSQYHFVAYASWSLTTHEHNYHSMKQEFLVLKWAIAKQFWEYLLWKRSLSGLKTICSSTSLLLLT